MDDLPWLFAKRLNVSFPSLDSRTFNEIVEHVDFKLEDSREIQEHLQKIKLIGCLVFHPLIWENTSILVRDDATKQNKNLVGFCGFASSGKDTCGEVCKSAGFRQLSFAGPLRDFAFQLNTVFPSCNKSYQELLRTVGYESAKRDVPEFREHLIAIGDGARTVISPTIWIDALDMTTGPTVVTDVRYANEGLKVQSLGGIVVYVRRPGVEAAHPTEAESISKVKYDYLVDNDGTIEEVNHKVTKILNSIL